MQSPMPSARQSPRRSPVPGPVKSPATFAEIIAKQRRRGRRDVMRREVALTSPARGLMTEPPSRAAPMAQPGSPNIHYARQLPRVPRQRVLTRKRDMG